MNGHGVEQIIYFVVIAIIAIARALSRGKRDTSTPTPPGTPARTNRPPADSEYERQRRFREALGLPPDTATPPLVKPRPTPANPPPLQQIPPMGASPTRRIYTGVPRRAAAPVQPPAVPVRPLASAPPSAPAAPIPVAWVPDSPQTMIAPAPIEQPAPLVPVYKSSKAPSPAPAAAPTSQQTFPASALLLSLRDPASIRKAIILREVLGLPKALQPSFIGAGTLWAGR